MGVHKLTAGDGYTYLTRSVAAVDATERGFGSLESYYSARGESPGVWLGRGLAGLADSAALVGLTVNPESAVTLFETPGEAAARARLAGLFVVSGRVTEDQMKALFGEGRHPNAEAIDEALQNAGRSVQVADAAGKLGSKFAVFSGETPWREALAEAFEAYNQVHGHPSDYPVPTDDRARIKTDVAGRLFVETYGREPADGYELTNFVLKMSRPRTSAVAGYDLTFSPVKSVSTLWAVADPDTARQIEDAHRAAVQTTLAYVEERAAFTRVGRHSVRQVETRGLIMAAFTHRDSRAGDPDLHTHVAVSNKVQVADDGRWMALDGQMVFRTGVDASEYYNSQLEAEVSARLGASFEPRQVASGRRPVREIDGVDPALNARWSSRRVAIEAATEKLATKFVADHGRVPTTVETLALAQQATLSTRQAKHEPRSEREQRAVWQGQAVQVLGSAAAVSAMLDGVRRDVAVAPVTVGLVEELAAATVEAVAGKRARWREDNLRAEARRQVRAVGIDPDLVNAVAAVVADRAKSADYSISLDNGSRTVAAPTPAALIRQVDGQSQYTVSRGQLFTSTAILAAEQRIVDAAGRGGGFTIAAADLELAELEWSANHGGRRLNHGQLALLSELGRSDRLVQLGNAPAGTGKTTVMGVYSRAIMNAGGSVIGLAPQAVAAKGLGQALAGGHDDTLHKMVDLLHTDPAAWPDWMVDVDARTVVIVDEAGLATTPLLDEAIEFVTGRGGRVILLGDDRQRAAIGAGGILRDIHAAHGSVTLTEVVRFADRTEGQASLAVRAGDTAAVGFYLDRGRLHTVSQETVFDELYAAWAADIAAGKDSIMLAPLLDQVDHLNVLARAGRLAAAVAAGIEIGPEIDLPSAGGSVSAGDIVVSKDNNRRLIMGETDFVKNGDRWTVTAVLDDGSLAVTHLERGVEVVLPADYIADGNVRLGYAHTIAGDQGVTVGAAGVREGTAHALIIPDMARNDFYVALTRAITANHAWVLVAAGDDPHARINPDVLSPDTAAGVVVKIIERDGDARSALTEIREAAAPAALLGYSAAVYADSIVAAAETLAGPEEIARITAAAEQAVPGVTTAPAWETLRGHLLTLALTGRDPVAALGAAAAQRELRTADDIAAVLDWRLDTTGNHSLGAGPLPWLPARPAELLDVPEWGPFITAWADKTESHLVDTRAEAAAWTVDTAPRWALPYLSNADLTADLASWRATEGVQSEDLRPAGERPLRLTARKHYYDLVEKAQRVTGDPADGAARWAAHLAALGLDPTTDDHWPVLAGRLTLADTAGVNVPRLLAVAAAQGPLPVENTASALWWRLVPHLPDLNTAASGPGQHQIRPAWTAQLVQILGADTTDRIVADPLWPVLIARLDAAERDGHDAAAVAASAATAVHRHGDLRPDQHATVLMWTVALLTDPEPLADTDAETAPVDSAERDRQAPADWDPAAAGRDTLIPTPATVDADAAARRGADPLAGEVEPDWSVVPLPDEPPADPDEEPDPDDAAPAEAATGAESTVLDAHLARLSDALAAAAQFYLDHADTSWVPGYLQSRGLPADTAGYAPRGARLVGHLRGLGFADDEIRGAGLAGVDQATGRLYDFFRDRAMLPVTGPDGRITGFVGRKSPSNTNNDIGKYVNSPGTELYRKSEQLYGLTPDAVTRIRAGAAVALVEGPMDVEAVNTTHRGIGVVALAPSGTALTTGQLAALNAAVGLTDIDLIVAFDNDRAGQTAALRAYQLLSDAGVDHPTMLAPFTAKDLSELLETGGPDQVIDAFTHIRPLADLVVDAAIDKATFRSVWEVVPTIADLPVDQRWRQAARLADAFDADSFNVFDQIHAEVAARNIDQPEQLVAPVHGADLGLPTRPVLRTLVAAVGVAADGEPARATRAQLLARLRAAGSEPAGPAPAATERTTATVEAEADAEYEYQNNVDYDRGAEYD